ncbi:hypothetical protein DCAR_0206119 [Daucus carota subsp. sativus]|uniref:Uncharacterized protein n=1 Tax=Daucus carota subsp. sativus TaxID=79200 RepID=A0AAF0WBJ2_DAUCS|nr:hypothetical protein DCAR_0206119 [Daucus carota subsp. sativus]
MFNTIGWVTFYWHWKHITLWQGNVSQFNESSTYLMGWLRDYLWLNSSQLINGYNPFGMNKLIETLAWAHERTPLANLIRWREKPVALSIVQARLGWISPLFRRLYIHLCGFLDCLYIVKIWLIF